MPEFVLVLTTFPVDRDVDALARALIDERLAACVNVLPPMQSIYRWKGDVETATERQVIIKTKAARVEALATRIKELHPYETPEFLVVNIETGGDEYLSWLRENC